MEQEAPAKPEAGAAWSSFSLGFGLLHLQTLSRIFCSALGHCHTRRDPQGLGAETLAGSLWTGRQ